MGIKITESIFFPICIQPNGYEGKFTNGYEGICMNWAKIPKPWQVTGKSMSDFSYFTFTNDSNSRNNNS